MLTATDRTQRGYELAQSMEIRQVRSDLWMVPSQSGNGEYSVLAGYSGYSCTCPDYEFRHEKVGECKHIWALKYYLKLKEKVQEDIVEQINPTDVLLCKYCNSSNAVKYGVRGKRVRKQIYLCKDCGHRFILDTAFEKMRNDPKIISLTLSMYFRNMSLRSISQTIEETYGMHIAHQTIHDWIKKYEGLLSEYVAELTPNISGKLNIDEVWIKVKGEMKYLFNALDPDTRFMLASVLSQRKDMRGARKVLHMARVNAKHQPIKQITTDALVSYKKAFVKEFAYAGYQSKHIAGVSIRGDKNNNIVERYNGTIRDRENFRGLKEDDTPIINLNTIFYNFIREHSAIGMTPAQAAGIGYELGKDKWLGLIRKAKINENNTAT